MATWTEIRQWQPDAVGRVGDHLAAQNKLVIGLQDDVDDARPSGWTGAAADDADKDLRSRRQALEELAARLSAAVKIIDDTERSVRDLVRDAESTEDYAANNGYRIENDKIVQTADTGGFLTGATLQVNVQVILAQAAAIDTELNSVLARILSGEIDDAGATTLAAAAAEGEDRIADEQRHRDLLEKYQVKTDATTVWPTGLTGWLAERAGFNKQEIT